MPRIIKSAITDLMAVKIKSILLFALFGAAFILNVSVACAFENLLDKARGLRSQKKFPEAVSVYREALKRDPGHLAVKRELGQTLSWMGDYRGAHELFDQILAKHPEDQDTRLAKALVLSWQGSFDKAISLLLIVVKAVPDYADAHISLGRIHGWNKKYKLAEEHYKKALKHSPGNIDATAGLGKLYRWSGQHKKGISIYKKLLEKDPESIKTMTHLAFLYRDKGQYAKAIELLERVRDKEPQRADIRAELGHLYARTQKLDNAVTELERVVAMRKGDLDSYVALGRVLSYQNKLDEAISHYNKVLDKNPRHIDALTGLARTYGYARQWKKARETWTRAQALAPLSLEVKDGLKWLNKINAPQIEFRYMYYNAREAVGALYPRTDTRYRGAETTYIHKFTPDRSISIRGARFFSTETNLADGVIVMKSGRTEAGAGANFRVADKLTMFGRVDGIKFSNRLSSGTGGVTRGAGFAGAQWGHKKHFVSAVVSKELFEVNTDDENFAVHSILSGSLSEDYDINDYVSVLLSGGKDKITSSNVTRSDLSGRLRLRMPFWTLLLFEYEHRYRDRQIEKSDIGSVSFKQELWSPKATVEFEYSSGYNSLSNTKGQTYDAFFSWALGHGFHYNQEIAYRKDVTFKGIELTGQSYLSFVF
ncbi:tetratricopeptide repeat protein [Elusimicrobiota bacterium]